MCDLIVSVPDHCLSFYFSLIGNAILIKFRDRFFFKLCIFLPC